MSICLECAMLISYTDTDQQYNFVVGLETVLLGHEDWVYSVCWQPPTVAGTSSYFSLYAGVLCHIALPSLEPVTVDT